MPERFHEDALVYVKPSIALENGRYRLWTDSRVKDRVGIVVGYTADDYWIGKYGDRAIEVKFYFYQNETDVPGWQSFFYHDSEIAPLEEPWDVRHAQKKEKERIDD